MTREKKATGMLLRASSLLLMPAMLLLASCGGTVFHEFRSIDGGSWSRDDTLTFLYGGSFNKEVTGYNLLVEARVDASYSYRSLVARVECLSGKDSSFIVADTLCCEIFGNEGQRKGATAGILYQVSSAPMYVEAKGCDTLFVRVSHIMDACELAGVSDVGIRLKSSYGHVQRQSSEK